MCHPIVHFLEHYPNECEWLPSAWAPENSSLTPHKALEEWSKLICPQISFFSLGLELPGLYKLKTFEPLVTSNSEITLDFNSTKYSAKEIQLKCYMRDSNNKEVPYRARVIYSFQYMTTLYAYFPSQGEFVLDIHGKLDNESKGYQPVLKLKVTNRGHGSCKIFPKIK